MKKILFMLLLPFIFYTFCFGADQGEAIFHSNRCGICHKPDTSASNPSLKDIAGAYKGKKEQLQNYLSGKADAIVNPVRSVAMKRYVEKTKSL